MKKEKLWEVLFIFLILVNLSFLQAQSNSTTEEQKIDDAYSCLIGLVQNRTCTTLSTEEKIFALFSINRCKPELLEVSSNAGECWPSGNCNLKTTAQATLALKTVGEDTTKAKDWLFSQTRSPTELIWYLQIESSQSTTCSIAYSPGPQGSPYSMNIGEDKKISSGAGPCLEVSEEGYWLRIHSNCLNQEFTISCDESFSTNLLFKRSGSSLIYVLGDMHSASATSATTEKVKSHCFAQGTTCSYEGSLWAALILNSLGEDVSGYLPYLMVLSEEQTNQKFLPQMFLYSITSNEDYLYSLLTRQSNEGWWLSHLEGDRYFDTALAILPLQSQTREEVTRAKQWFLSIQDQSGCWQGNNIRNTAFILASVWPRQISPTPNGTGGQTPYCEPTYNCVPLNTCGDYGGQVLGNYYCGGFSECCTAEPVERTCGELGGQICPSGTTCSINTISAGDTSVCCLGICQTYDGPTESECVQQAGVCYSQIEGCPTNRESVPYFCDLSSDICCVLKQPDSARGFQMSLWVWILIILIILVILGIIFKSKLREFLLKIKTKSRKQPRSGPPGFGPRFGPGPSGPPRPPMNFPPRPPPRGLPPSRSQERRFLPQPYPSQQPKPNPQKTKPKSSKDLDEVLKKLKEMGN